MPQAIGFIHENQARPFFNYLPYSMPHIPLYVPDDVRDPDPQRAYINTIEHLDDRPVPTIAAITGTPLPADRAIDGIDISSRLSGTAKSMRNEFLYDNAGGRIEGIREGDWKLHAKAREVKKELTTPTKPDVMPFNLADDSHCADRLQNRKRLRAELQHPRAERQRATHRHNTRSR